MILDKKIYRKKFLFFDIFHFILFRNQKLPFFNRKNLKLDINLEKCTACIFCVDVCPVNAIKIDYSVDVQKNVRLINDFSINHQSCFLCDECVVACPDDALSFVENNNITINVGSDDEQIISHHTH